MTGFWKLAIALDSGEEAKLQYARSEETYEIYSPGEVMLMKLIKYGWDYEKYDPPEYSSLKRLKPVTGYLTSCKNEKMILTDRDGFKTEYMESLDLNSCKIYENGYESGDDRIVLQPINTGRPGKNRLISVMIRSRNTGCVIAGLNGQLISYTDNENNRIYEDNKLAECVWDVIWDENGYISFIQKEYSITVENNGSIILELYDDTNLGQKFVFVD